MEEAEAAKANRRERRVTEWNPRGSRDKVIRNPKSAIRNDILRPMRVPSVRFLRRSLIGIICIVLLAVLSNYILTWHRRARSAKTPPQILGAELKRSANLIEISESRDGIVRFKLHAQRLDETTGGKRLLQGIDAYDFNPDGSVRHQIRSQRAEYDEQRRTADFSGDVQLLFNQRVQLQMDSLHYDLAAGVASSPDFLRIDSDQVNGTAKGIRFDRKQQLLTIDSQADFVLTHRWNSGKKSSGPGRIHAVSNQAYYSETERRIVFQGDVRIESEGQALYGQMVEAKMDPLQQRLTSLVARGDARYESVKGEETQVLAGDQLAFGIGASKTLEKIHVTGKALFSAASPARQEALRGEEIDIFFDPQQVPTRVAARTGVSLETSRGQDKTLISGGRLDADFFAGTNFLQAIHIQERAAMKVGRGPGAQDGTLQADRIRIDMRRAEGRSVLGKLTAEGNAEYVSRAGGGPKAGAARTLRAHVLELRQSPAGDYFESGNATGRAPESVVFSEEASGAGNRPALKQLKADKARFSFFPGDNRLRDLDAEGDVQVRYERAGGRKGDGPVESFRTTSDKLRAVFETGSADTIRTVSQWGNFTFTDSLRTAKSERCDYDARSGILVLRESPEIADRQSSTMGDRIEYDQAGGVMTVTGRVRSVLRPGAGQGSFFGSSSSSSPGIVTAAEMRYWNATGRVLYSGKVQLLAENQQLQSGTLETSPGLDELQAKGGVRHLIVSQEKGSRDSARVITVQSAGLHYLKKSSRITYTGSVRLHSDEVELESDVLDAVIDPEAGQIRHAKAGGNVLVRAGGREAKGDAADYYTEPEKFVITGDPAEIYDPGRGRSYARRLTSRTADDTILLENR